jgi:uridine kinase
MLGGITRAELVARLAHLLSGHTAEHTVRVAVDGPDAAGKTTLADELAVVLRQTGRSALRASFDDFHRPRHERHQRGPLSPEGYFRDCFDFPALRRLVLQPLGPDGNGRFQPALRDYRTEELYQQPAQVAPARSMLLVDGVFLLTDELRDCWDLSLFLDVSPAETLRRALVRDTDLFGSPTVVRERYQHRYLPGQQLYRTAVRPTQVADVVLDYDDPDAPLIRKWPAKDPVT